METGWIKQMSNQLIGDIRAVNKWNWVEPEWDGVTIPRPQKQLMPTEFEIQVRKVIVTEEGLPALSDWVAIQVFDEYPEDAQAKVII
jgi:hypothetical protein